MAPKKRREKIRSRHEVFLRYYNQGISNAQVAEVLHCSVRTVCRWKRAVQHAGGESERPHAKVRRVRQRVYGIAVFELMVQFNQALPARSAAAIARLLGKEYPGQCTSESSIRKYLVSQGFSFKKILNRQGYIKFKRDKPLSDSIPFQTRVPGGV